MYRVLHEGREAVARRRAGLLVRVILVEPGQPRGQPLYRRLGLGEQVDELAQPFRQPAQADLVIRAPVEQFLDTAVGKVHAYAPGRASSTRCWCSALCAVAEPTAGGPLAGSEITPTPPPTMPGRFRAMVGQAPMLAGSS